MATRRKTLVTGPNSGPTSPEKLKEREAVLRGTVEHYLPDFAKAMRDSLKNGIDVMMMHQDAFAAAYHDDEYLLLGMCVKYAGLHGMSVTISGTNRETC